MEKLTKEENEMLYRWAHEKPIAPKVEIVSVWGQNTNEFYHPDRQFDGGGYFQPQGGAVVRLADGREVVALLKDYSAGAFGTRYQFLMVSPSGETILQHFGGVDGDDTPYADLCAAVGEDYRAFHREIDAAVRWAAHMTGGCANLGWFSPKNPFGVF